MADAEIAHPEIAPFPNGTRDLPVEVEVCGVLGRVTVAAPVGPGAVRTAVEKALRGLAVEPR